ncbi:hypothetical protein SAMN05518668_104387 [Sphingobium sp. YR657]|uniref:hypothetical protein n=1 Tax=Sphingobium sp. YR657 TaxID=1884366 RepID=UPI00091FB129|nr:hypothetical protein [Sphingobium sp. YR657]SHL97071.1 hypothetical protein SAMN05518668_104387 [Sphingobium sp. YR657]
MARLYIRARLVNAYRRVFPHPAVVAQRERRRVATQAAGQRIQAGRDKVIAAAAQLRASMAQQGGQHHG